MKKPRVSFSKAGMLSFLVRHGEKLVVVLVCMAASGLAWGGMSALRTLRPTAKQLPKSIIADAEATSKHIDAIKIAPDAELTSEKGLAKAVAPWSSPQIVPPPNRALLNKPLFNPLAVRKSPKILPIEDLRTVSGVAVLALKPKPTGDRPVPERSLNLDAPPAPTKPTKPPRGGGGRFGQPPPPPPEMAMMQPRPDQLQPVGKVVPYVIVTGLIPVVKQLKEYDEQFGNASFRDPAIDTPRWSGYSIERTEVLPGTDEKWTPIDIKAVGRRYGAEWAGIQPEPWMAALALSTELERRDATTTIPFCSPLPQLSDGAWGFNAFHPWFTDFVRRDAAERKAAELKRQQDASENGGVFNAPGTGTFPPGTDPSLDGSGAVPGFAGGADMAMQPGMEGRVLSQGPEYRLFRFIDFAVIPGRTYRYRVKLSCWNPNYNVSGRHLAEASLAKSTMLGSAVSAASQPVVVVDGTKMLVQPLKKQEIKRLKTGALSVLILGDKQPSGGFALRQLLMEVGGLANVDPDQNKRGDVRSVGDAITTDRVLLDIRGKLEDRSETRAGKPTPPPEPLEMIFLRPDGTFEVATSADSQVDIDRYRHTLQEPQDPNRPPGAPDWAPAGAPFGNPFAPKR